MKTLYKKIIILTFGLFLVVLVAVGIWQKDVFFVSKTLAPISSGDIVQSVITNIEKSGLTLLGIPVVLGDSIKASVSGVQVVFGIDKDISIQVRALQLVLGKLTINRLPKEIDLRFNKAIIRY